MKERLQEAETHPEAATAPPEVAEQPSVFTPEVVISLQRTAGNQKVSRFLATAGDDEPEGQLMVGRRLRVLARSPALDALDNTPGERGAVERAVRAALIADPRGPQAALDELHRELRLRAAAERTAFQAAYRTAVDVYARPVRPRGRARRAARPRDRPRRPGRSATARPSRRRTPRPYAA